jgi:hypothetical protein
MMDDSLGEARRRLPLPDLLRQLGLGECAQKSAHCPFAERHKHNDKRKSFSIRFNSKTGRHHWKCFAGCGSGDEISFLQAYFNFTTFGDAKAKYKELAGVNGSDATAAPFSWNTCVEKFGATQVEQVADWRGYNGKFVSELKEKKLIGLFKGRVAFPVYDDARKVVGCHYRLRDNSWRYFPVGILESGGHRLFVIGELVPEDPAHSFESQWDGFSYMDASGDRDGIIISRGAANGACLPDLLQPGTTIYCWVQNDIAGERWLRDISANRRGLVKAVRVPPEFKDLNDWVKKGGASEKDLLEAMLKAETIASAQGNIQADGSKDGAATAGEQAAEVDFAAARLPVEPEPEPEEVEKEIPPYPIQCLPTILRDMAVATADLHGNLAMAGTILLGAASAAIGKGIRVRNGRNHVTPANLFVLVSKTSGSGGSEAARCIMKPFLDEHYKRKRIFKEQEKPAIEGEIEKIQAQLESLKSKLKKEDSTDQERNKISAEVGVLKVRLTELKEREALPLFTSNVTPAALTARLAKHDETIMHYESDVGTALAILTGQSENGKGSGSEQIIQLDVWLKGFSWEPTSNMRVSSGIQDLKNPCIALTLLMTPDKARALFGDTRLTETGFLPRCIVVDPKAQPMPWDPERAAKMDDQRKGAFEKHHAGFAAVIERFRFFEKRRWEEEEETDPEPYLIGMDEEAKQLDIDDYNRTIAAFGPGEEHPFEARRNEIAIRLALVLYVFACIRFESENGKLQGVAFAHEEGRFLTGEWMKKALELMDYYDRQQKEFRLISESKEEDRRCQLIRTMIMERGAVRVLDVWHRKRIFRTKKEATAKMNDFVAAGIFVQELRKPKGGGHEFTVYKLPPKSDRF